jgi:endoglucanase
MESVSANPVSYGWTNVMYSFHEYDMEGSNFNNNKKTYQSEVGGYISQSNSFNIPSYVGEFMTTGRTLTWMLQQMDTSKIWWSGWTYTTVSQGNWGLYNFGSSMDVDVSTDSYTTIMSKWSNMGAKSVTSIASLYKAGAMA